MSGDSGDSGDSGGKGGSGGAATHALPDGTMVKGHCRHVLFAMEQERQSSEQVVHSEVEGL